MFRLFRRGFTISLFLSVVFIGVSSGNAFASQRPTYPPKIVVKASISYYQLDCTASFPGEEFYIDYSESGNADECSLSGIESGFYYEPASLGNATGVWSFSTPDYLHSCNIDAWFPPGPLSSGTKAFYDFWYGNRWLGWVGHDINQDTAPAGWNPIATNIPINDSGQSVTVTLHNDGGSQNLAFAAMSFSCT